MALLACETFRLRCNVTLRLFETLKRKPIERRNLLKSSGCNEKYIKVTATIPVQEEALTTQICRGRVQTIEDAILSEVFKKMTHGSDTTGWEVVLADSKYKATFKGDKHAVEKSFDGVASAIDWLKSMSIAEKDRVLHIKNNILTEQ